MPELPEVETIRRQLEPAVSGRRIESVEVFDERWTRPTPPRHVVEALEGRTTHEVRYLRAAISLDDGSRLLYADARRFGHAIVLDGYGLEGYLSERLGIEPLTEELTADALGRLAAGRRAPLKSFLLNQSAIAGLGNIYADEALHRAGLHPLSPAGSLRAEDCERLRRGIVETLEEGLRSGGASIDDYRDARGEEGTMQDEFLVHTREGEPCRRCGTTIQRVIVGGRSTYYCPGCQRRLRARPRRRAVASRG
jgi:formamidopyrimidine-DNA glycosylase